MSKLLILYYYLKTYLFKFKNRKELKKWQKKKFNKFKKNILIKSPFYSKYVKKELKDFPIINKELMMKQFNIMNTELLTKGECFNIAIQAEEDRDFSPQVKGGFTVGLSSGTSGNRGLFIASNKERSMWAGFILAKMLPKSLFKNQRIALFLRANSNLYQAVNSKHICFDFYDLIRPFEELVNELNNNNPDILIAPAQVLRLLAKEQRTKALSITPIKIVAAAEVLEYDDKKFIEESFKIKVDSIYQCTEGFLGTTCEHGTLHINEDIFILEKEWIDKKTGRFVPILTDFVRETQPIIRYRLDDILIEKKEPCKCGSVFTAIEKIEGRCDDIFIFKDKKNNDIQIFPDFIRNKIIIADPDVKDYRVYQVNKNQVDFYILTDNFNLSKKLIEQEIIKFFKSKEINIPNLNFYNKIEQKGIDKKRQRIKRIFR